MGKKKPPKKLVGSYFVVGERLGRIISVDPPFLKDSLIYPKNNTPSTSIACTVEWVLADGVTQTKYGTQVFSSVFLRYQDVEEDLQTAVRQIRLSLQFQIDKLEAKAYPIRKRLKAFLQEE